MTPIMTTEEAADYLRLRPQTLHNRRHRGGGPPYVKIGSLVRYRREDLDAWIADHVRASTAGEG